MENKTRIPTISFIQHYTGDPKQYTQAKKQTVYGLERKEIKHYLRDMIEFTHKKNPQESKNNEN